MLTDLRFKTQERYYAIGVRVVLKDSFIQRPESAVIISVSMKLNMVTNYDHIGIDD